MAADADGQKVNNEDEEGIRALPHLVVKISGTKRGDSATYEGTGFFYRFQFGDITVPLIITNRHVVRDMHQLTFDFALRGKSNERVYGPPERATIQTDRYPIFQHPNPEVDLVAIPAYPIITGLQNVGKEPFFLHLSSHLLPPPWLNKRLIASTNVLMIGFPNGLMDHANNLPLTRRGILATPYHADYNGQPDFVVDIAAFGGSSGSPVFAIFEGPTPLENGTSMLGNGAIYFIGILHSGPVVSAVGEVVTVPVPMTKQIAHTSLMMHLGYCHRAELVEDFKAPILAQLPEAQLKNLTDAT